MSEKYESKLWPNRMSREGGIPETNSEKIKKEKAKVIPFNVSRRRRDAIRSAQEQE